MDVNEPLNSSKHLPALDGLRGMAVLLVLLHHASPGTPLEAGALERAFFEIRHVGWIGVDIFFVLSGFLITGILFEAKDKPRYFRNFYGRRVLRIFPIYYLLLAAVIIIHLFQHPDTPPLRGAQAWYWLYLQNFKMAQWDDFGVSSLSVTWSLAIEEQFYLLWPMIVFLTNRRSLLRVCVLTLAGVFALRVALIQWGIEPATLYKITPTRLDGLAVGATLALILRSKFDRKRATRIAGATLILATAICASIFFMVGGAHWNEALVVMGGYGAIALGSGGLLILTLLAQERSYLNQFFSSNVMIFFGKYSYALYLFHPLIIKGLRKGLKLPGDTIPMVMGSHLIGQLCLDLAILAGSLAAALISWHLVEKYCLRLKSYFASAPTQTRSALES